MTNSDTKVGVCSPSITNLDDDDISIKHLKDFHLRIGELRKNSLLMDFEIIIDKTVIPAHRLVLAASSEYFRCLFSVQSKEANTNRVDIKDISVPTMEAILDYCYTCNIDLDDENVERILVAASKLLIEPIQSLCSAYILERIDNSNCLGVANLSDRCNVQPLHSRTLEFCIEKFESVVKEREFYELEEHMLEMFLPNDSLNIGEAELFEALILWTRRDVDNRNGSFDKLVNHIRFGRIDPAKLVVFSSDEIVKNSATCKSLIDQAKNYHLLKDHPSLRSEIPNILVKPRDNLLSRQCIYAIGGWSDRYNAISKVEVYDPNQNVWIETKPMFERRCGLGCASHGDNIYAVGGHDGQNYLSSIERFDTAKEEWVKDIPNMTSARTSVGTVVLDNCLYAIGGQTSTGATDKVEKFDFETKTWLACKPMNQPRLGAGVAILNGYIYVVGGAENKCIEPNVFNSVERYDPSKNSWTYVASMITERKHLGCTSYNGKLYAIAGRKGGRELDTAELYDPMTDSWSELPRLRMKRHGVIVAELSGHIYAIGGQNDDIHLSVVEAYNPSTMEWQWKQPMISDRLGGGIAVHPVRKY